MLRRRARPTLRLLREDLGTRLDDPRLGRALADGAIDELHPLSDLPHPIVQKASEAFGEDPDQDHHEGRIRCCHSIDLWEIKVGQWRGGVWIAEDGVCWLVACGLAKGNHEDYDDFYQVLARLESGPGATTLRPTANDIRLWKREVVSDALTRWEGTVQEAVAKGLSQVHAGGSTRFDISHPLEDRLPTNEKVLSQVTLAVDVVREEDYHYDDVTVTFASASRWSGSDLEWQLILRVLISISPPEQGWDRFKSSFSTMAEPGALTARVQELEDLVSRGSLAESVPGQHAHHAHRRSLTERTINGRAVRALCGAFFVPFQDHDTLPVCPTCSQRIDELDRAVGT